MTVRSTLLLGASASAHDHVHALGLLVFLDRVAQASSVLVALGGRTDRSVRLRLILHLGRGVARTLTRGGRQGSDDLRDTALEVDSGGHLLLLDLFGLVLRDGRLLPGLLDGADAHEKRLVARVVARRVLLAGRVRLALVVRDRRAADHLVALAHAAFLSGMRF